MNENHIIVATSKIVDSPKRAVSIEETVKGGVCRSCKDTLDVGEPRIKVSYPNVIVQYAARVGAPAFFMHPECFKLNPVDFWRIGTAAYKETMPVACFSLNPELDVLGWDRFPEVHHCFRSCRELWLAQQMGSKATSAIPNVSDVSTVERKETGRHHLEPMHTCSGETTVVPTPESHDHNFKLKLASETLVDIRPHCPQKRRATDTLAADISIKRVSAASNDHAQVHKSTYQEDQQQVADRQSPKLTIQGCTESEHYHVGMEDCLCSCHCRFFPEQRQWATPSDAAKILGISVAILRSLAIARAIPVLIRPSGQRVYNIPSIRKFISEHTLQPINV